MLSLTKQRFLQRPSVITRYSPHYKVVQLRDTVKDAIQKAHVIYNTETDPHVLKITVETIEDLNKLYKKLSTQIQETKDTKNNSNAWDVIG